MSMIPNIHAALPYSLLANQSCNHFRCYMLVQLAIKQTFTQSPPIPRFPQTGDILVKISPLYYKLVVYWISPLGEFGGDDWVNVYVITKLSFTNLGKVPLNSTRININYNKSLETSQQLSVTLLNLVTLVSLQISSSTYQKLSV